MLLLQLHLLHHAFRSQVICTIVTENLPPDNTLLRPEAKTVDLDKKRGRIADFSTAIRPKS